MDTVRKDLKQKMEQMEKVEKEKRKNNDIRIITCERDFFRQEAIRLNKLCKELSIKVEELTRELKFQSNELINLSKKWKESENTNKQLIVELERNIQINKELDNQIKMVHHENLINSQFNNNQNQAEMNNMEYINVNEEFNEFNKGKLLAIVEKLKLDLKKEKMRNHKILGEFNKMLLDRNKLEKIFIDSVEECRKDIYNRKLKETLGNKTHTNFNKTQNMNINIVPYINDIKYDNFLPTDKKKLIEIFILKEEVINLIRDYVFRKIEDTNNLVNENKNDLMQTKSSFLKTDKLFNISNKKKTPASGISYAMMINRSKTPNINY
jgi:hypothetical protein